MYIFCIIESLFKFIGPWPMTKGTLNVIGANGSVGLCEFQGAMITIGHAVLVYYASLSIYAYLSIENDFNVDALKKREWMIHLAAVLIPIVPTIFAIVKNLYNPTTFVCTVNQGYDPPDCFYTKVSGCNVRGTDHDEIIVFFLFLPFYLCLILTTVITLFLLCKQVIKRKKDEQYFGKRRYINEFRKKKAVLVTKQTLCYLFAVYLAYGVDQTVATLHYFEANVPFVWQVIGEVLFSFHGVIIAVVHIVVSGDTVDFLGIKVGRSLSIIEIHINEQKKNIQASGTEKVGTNSNSNSNSNANLMRRSVAFSIFQELTEDEKWNKFGVYVGSEDDEDDSLDIEIEHYVDNTPIDKRSEGSNASIPQGHIITNDSPFQQKS